MKIVALVGLGCVGRVKAGARVLVPRASRWGMARALAGGTADESGQAQSGSRMGPASTLDGVGNAQGAHSFAGPAERNGRPFAPVWRAQRRQVPHVPWAKDYCPRFAQICAELTRSLRTSKDFLVDVAHRRSRSMERVFAPLVCFSPRPGARTRA